MRQSSLLRLLAVQPFAVFVLHSLYFSSWIIDDAGISFAYARNFIHGHGLVAQAGTPPVEGFSNPLWTLLISPIFLGDPLSPVLAVKLLSMALVFGTYLFVQKIAILLFPEPPWAMLVTFAILFPLSVNTSFVAWTTSGLENPLYAFLAVLYCYLLMLHGGEEGSKGRAITVWAGISAAGLALTRPDGVLFFACYPVVAVLLATGKRKGSGRTPRVEWGRASLFSVSALAPALLYLAFRYLYFGRLLPNTYYAKKGPALPEFAKLFFIGGNYLEKAGDLVASMFPREAGILPHILIVAVLLAWLKGTRRKVFSPLILLAIVSLAIYCMLPADWMGEYRFATPFFLMFYMVLGIVTADAVERNITGSKAAIFYMAYLSLLLGSSAAEYFPRTLKFAARSPVSFNYIARRTGMQFNYYADTLDIAEASLLCVDMGGTLYYSRHRVYDLAGLCDRRLAKLIWNDDQTFLRDYLFDELRPTFIQILNDEWSLRTAIHKDPRFRESYAAIHEKPSERALGRGKEGYFTGDYVLLEALDSESELKVLQRKMESPEAFEKTSRIEMSVPFPRP